MKKTILAFLLMASTVQAVDLSLYERVTDAYVASTNRFVVFKELTAQEKYDYLNQYCITQSIEHAGASFGLPQYILNLVDALNEESPELGNYVYWDSRLDQIEGMIRPSWWSIDIDSHNRKKFPKCWDNWAKGPVTDSVKDTRPATYRYINNTNESVNIPCAINYYIELRSTGNIQIGSISAQNKNIVNLMLPTVRRYMRKNGESILTVEGHNPLQAKVDEIISTLEAPKCQGFKELVLKYFPNFDWIEVTFLSDKDLDALKDKVYNGDIEFSPTQASLLFVNMGVDAYEVERVMMGKE